VAGVSIVIPAYEERVNLRWLLPEISMAVDELLYGPLEVIVVVPDFASDDEIEEIRELGGRPIRRSPSNSFGDALRCGFAAVNERSAFTVVMDADGSHSPSTIPRLLIVSPGIDVVVASRYTHGGTSDNSLPLRLMSRSLNLAFRWVLDIRCRDVSTNFKRFRTQDVLGVSLVGSDFDVVEELLFRVKHLHGHDFSLVEVPDHFSERRYGTTKRRLGPYVASYLTTLVRLRWQQRKIR
jgi:dolichol-phosphate mannosyltransferase